MFTDAMRVGNRCAAVSPRTSTFGRPVGVAAGRYWPLSDVARLCLQLTRSHARSLWGDWSPLCPEAHQFSRRELFVSDLHDLLRELLGAR
jgi:hypothetical protein